LQKLSGGGRISSRRKAEEYQAPPVRVHLSTEERVTEQTETKAPIRKVFHDEDPRGDQQDP